MGGYGSYLQSMLKLVPWFVVPVYTFFWQGIYRIYGHIWCIYPVLASPVGNMTCVPFQVSAELEKCQCGALYTLGAFEKHVYLSPLCLPCHTWSQERRQSSHKRASHHTIDHKRDITQLITREAAVITQKQTGISCKIPAETSMEVTRGVNRHGIDAILSIVSTNWSDQWCWSGRL